MNDGKGRGIEKEARTEERAEADYSLIGQATFILLDCTYCTSDRSFWDSFLAWRDLIVSWELKRIFVLGFCVLLFVLLDVQYGR